MKEKYQMNIMMMSNAIGLQVFKNPYQNQYICQQGYHFVRDGKNIGRVLWTNNVDGYYIEKDEINTEEDSK